MLLTTASLQSGAQETNDARDRLQEIQTKAEAIKSAEEFLAETSEGLQELETQAERGDAEAQYNLGRAYLLGEGVPKDAAEAVKWWRKAAEQGIAEAQHNLGRAYFLGEGVPKDYVQAYLWLNLAAAGNLEQAARIRSLVERQMTREQIAEAQRLSAQFVPRKTSTDVINDLRPSLFATASATAFFVTPDGHLLTSYHVVENASRLQVVTPKGTFPARLVKSDPANDLALLKVSGNFSCLPLQSSRGERVGATVFTVGFPNLGLQGREPKLAEGTIASLSGVQDDPRYFQIGVPIQPGNSGGALVNSKGNVVGVIAAKLSQLAALRSSGSLPEGVNYAVKSSYALPLLESVPEVSAGLEEPHAREGRLTDLIDAVKAASALLLVEA